MATGLRASLAGYVYHVLNRSNGRLRIFGKDADFTAFEELVAEAMDRYPVEVLGYCIMGNHWHMLLWPKEDGILSDFMRRLSLIRIPQYSRAFINVARKTGEACLAPTRHAQDGHATKNIGRAARTMFRATLPHENYLECV